MRLSATKNMCYKLVCWQLGFLLASYINNKIAVTKHLYRKYAT